MEKGSGEALEKVGGRDSMEWEAAVWEDSETAEANA